MSLLTKDGQSKSLLVQGEIRTQRHRSARMRFAKRRSLAPLLFSGGIVDGG
jgi:hypothetical protein